MLKPHCRQPVIVQFFRHPPFPWHSYGYSKWQFFFLGMDLHVKMTSAVIPSFMKQNCFFFLFLKFTCAMFKNFFVSFVLCLTWHIKEQESFICISNCLYDIVVSSIKLQHVFETQFLLFDVRMSLCHCCPLPSHNIIHETPCHYWLKIHLDEFPRLNDN